MGTGVETDNLWASGKFGWNMKEFLLQAETGRNHKNHPRIRTQAVIPVQQNEALDHPVMGKTGRWTDRTSEAESEGDFGQLRQQAERGDRRHLLYITATKRGYWGGQWERNGDSCVKQKLLHQDKSWSLNGLRFERSHIVQSSGF